METEFGTLPDDLVPQIRYVTNHFGGWCTFEKARDMAAVVIRHRPAVVVEVGVYRGRSLIPLALAVRRNGVGVVYAIDAWAPDPYQTAGQPDSEKEFWGKNDFDADYDGFRAAVERYGLGGVVETVRAESAEAAASFGPAPEIDFLHLDSSHSEAASLEDVSLWLPLLKPGAWLILDDQDWPTMREALRVVESRCVKIADFGRYGFYRRLPVETEPPGG